MVRFILVSLSILGIGQTTVFGAEPDKLPLDFPAVAVTVESGQWVLCPPRDFVDSLSTKGVDKTTIIYYAAKMKESGPESSTVVAMNNKEMVIPNALIIPLPKGQKASPGDVLLTWWHSGSGMQRAMVVEGGTETEPMVMYLDIDYDNPSGWGKKTDRCRPDSFYKLDSPLQIGTVVAVKDPKFDRYARCLLVNVADDKCLLLGYAGRLRVASKADCVPVPVTPGEVKAGDAIWCPDTFHVFAQSPIVKIDPAIGRVFVVRSQFGKEKEVAVAYGNFLTSKPVVAASGK